MDRWLLGAAFAVALGMAGSWGSSIHGQLSSINSKLDAIVTAQATVSTELALLKLRIERLEGNRR